MWKKLQGKIYYDNKVGFVFDIISHNFFLSWKVVETMKKVIILVALKVK